MGIRPAVVIANVIKDDKGRFLIGMHKDGHKENQYAFPGGKVEDETIEEAFWRELEEETGLEKPKSYKPHIRFLGNSEFKVNDKRFLVMFYITPYSSEMGQPALIEPKNHFGWEWVKYEDFHKLPLAQSTKDFLELYSYIHEYGI